MIKQKPHRDRLAEFTTVFPQVASAAGLHREKATLFVGGELPIYETIETLYESYCMAATDLFYLSFGAIDSFRNGEEMARQIKKNFSVSLMARIGFPANRGLFERIYAAGVDLVEIPLPASGSVGGHAVELPAYLQDAVSIFPKWSVSATLIAGLEPLDSLLKNIDALPKAGIVPLVLFGEQSKACSPDEKGAILERLLASWKHHHVQLEPYLPLLDFMAPLDVRKRPGLLRGIMGKLKEQHKMISCDLRRHLRVQQASDSLDSAGL